MWREICVSTDDCRWLSRDIDWTKIEFEPPKKKCTARKSTDFWKVTGLLSLSLKSAKTFVHIFANKDTKKSSRKKKNQDTAILELYAEFPDIHLILKLAHELENYFKDYNKSNTMD